MRGEVSCHIGDDERFAVHPVQELIITRATHILMPKQARSTESYMRGAGTRLKVTERLASSLANAMPAFVRRSVLKCPLPLLDLLALLYLRIAEAPAPDDEFLNILQVIEPGSTVIEVGGNKGGLTTLLSKRVGTSGRVFSCEPNPISYSIMRRNLKGSRNTTSLNMGLGSDTTFRYMEMVGLSDSGASQHVLKSEGHALRFRARFVTLDWLAMHFNISKADFLVVDVEGSEPEVVAGGRALIARSPGLVILMELHPQVRAGVEAETINVLSGMGFRKVRTFATAETTTCVFTKS